MSILHIHTIEFVNHSENKWESEITWATNETHAINMFYKRHTNCSVICVNKLAETIQ